MDEHGSKTEFDSILFGKYMAGEASPEEVVLLEEWISRSATNKLLFEQYIATWNGFQIDGGYQLPDKASAWRLLNKNIKEQKKIPTVRSLFNRYSVAAVFTGMAILAIILLLLLTRTDRADNQKAISYTSASAISQNTLPDGSSIVLNSNSTLKVDEKFKSDRREAILEGEGYFSVRHDPKHPFLIHVDNLSIEVLGTSFNVDRNIRRGTIETQVSSGKVRMFNADGEIFIEAGQTGIYTKQSNSFLLRDTLDINSFSYATKNFVFSDEALSNIIVYLEKAYSKKIILENNLLGKCKMTSSFDNKPIEYILDVIATTLDITYSIKGDTIYIGGLDNEGC